MGDNSWEAWNACAWEASAPRGPACDSVRRGNAWVVSFFSHERITCAWRRTHLEPRLSTVSGMRMRGLSVRVSWVRGSQPTSGGTTSSLLDERSSTYACTCQGEMRMPDCMRLPNCSQGWLSMGLKLGRVSMSMP